MKTKNRQQVKKVLRIFHFKQRFELRDDVRFDRKRPLAYIRYYVGSGQDDESINFKRQITACKAKSERHKLISAFIELLEIASNHSQCYRGYLLDERFEPASTDKIANWLGLTVKETDKIMKELQQIGLIENVSMPKFDLSVNEQPKKAKKKRNSRNNSRAHEKTRAHTRKNEQTRKKSSAHGIARSGSSAFIYKGKNKDKSGSGNGNIKNKIKSGKPESNINSKTTTTPSTTQDPINPTETDREVGRRGINLQSLPRRSIDYKTSESLGSVLRRLYDPEAIQFAAEVYAAIGTPYPVDSREGKSEIGCWKSAWANAQLAGLNPSYLTELWDKTIKEANRLKLKRHRINFRKSPEAVLRDMFDKILKSLKRRAEKVDPIREIKTG